MAGISNEALIFMSIVWGVVFLAVSYCFAKILFSDKTLGDDPADSDFPAVDHPDRAPTFGPPTDPDAIQEGPSQDIKE